MIRKIVLFFGLCVLVGYPVVRAEPVQDAAKETPEWEMIFKRFDHGDHKRPIQKGDASCEGCHGEGVLSAAITDIRPPPPETCHTCHNPSDAQSGLFARPKAPSACTTCHETVLRPNTHHVDWLQTHGTEARLSTQNCESCHRGSFCVDCHERKNNMQFEVHDRTWISVHGIEAKVDPASCSACHQQTSCLGCHESTNGLLP